MKKRTYIALGMILILILAGLIFIFNKPKVCTPIVYKTSPLMEKLLNQSGGGVIQGEVPYVPPANPPTEYCE